MPTANCEPLLELCGPGIYSRNAFRLLGADVDQKGRRIKRIEKEFEAAIEVGELAEEYCVAFLPDPLPTREELSQVARQLADSQQRFIHEFFWFWPLEWGKSSADESLNLLKSGDEAGARARWTEIATEGGTASLVAMHNLAVLGHQLVLKREQEILGSVGSGASASPLLTDQERKELDACWSDAFRYWDPLCKDEAFRSLLADRIRALDDRRLTTGFLRRFLESLPVAFDNINAELAVAYCDREMYVRAEDHVEIMKATNAGDDDVDFSVRRVIGPLYDRIDHAVETATGQLAQKKVEGKQRSEKLISTVESILHVLRTLLGPESREYVETGDRVALSLLRCQVAYGNATYDWATSIQLLEEALAVSRGADTRARIEENLKIVRENRQANLCWFCGKSDKDDKSVVDVQMYGDVTRTRTFSGVEVQWRKNTVGVPRCLGCMSAHNRENVLMSLCGTVGVLLGIGGCVAGESMDALEYGLAALALGSALGFGVGAAIGAATRPKDVKRRSAMTEFPVIKKLVADGWKYGEKPNTDQ